MELEVNGKGYNEAGMRCYLVGIKDQRAFYDMVLVELTQQGEERFFVCTKDGARCEHVDAVKKYLESIPNLQAELKSKPRKANAKGAGKAGAQRIYITML